jgi:hypothetical protein
MTETLLKTQLPPINTDAKFGAQLKTTVFFLVCLALLLFGFSVRGEYYLTPESGLGYALGILGGVMMLLLLIYPLRKRFKFLGHVMKLKSWFRLHMLLGIVGPMCILFHCNFSLGSTNSNMALVSMCVMVLSGMIGRYFYSKIHMGLYGEKASLQELQNHRLFAVNQLEEDKQASEVSIPPELFQQLLSIESMATEHRGVLGTLVHTLLIGFRTRWTYLLMVWRLRSSVFLNAKNSGSLSAAQRRHMQRQTKKHIALFLSLIRKISQLSFFERLFSMWHALHLPIFFMLVVTGFIHVYAVHYY